MNTKRYPGTPCMFLDDNGDVVCGFTREEEDGYIEVIEYDPTDRNRKWTWWVKEDQITLDPEYDLDTPLSAVRLASAGPEVLALTFLVVGGIVGVLGGILLLQGNMYGMGGLGLGFIAVYIADRLDSRGGE